MKKLFAVALLGAICAMMAVPVYACYYTPGYWKNHPDAWPTDTVTICGTTYTKAEAIDILKMPPRGDISIKLAHHLIAAKLNFASGATVAYDGGQLIDDAEAALCAAGGIFSNPRGDARRECVYYLDLLDAANNTPW